MADACNPNQAYCRARGEAVAMVRPGQDQPDRRAHGLLPRARPSRRHRPRDNGLRACRRGAHRVALDGGSRHGRAGGGRFEPSRPNRLGSVRRRDRGSSGRTRPTAGRPCGRGELDPRDWRGPVIVCVASRFCRIISLRRRRVRPRAARARASRARGRARCRRCAVRLDGSGRNPLRPSRVCAFPRLLHRRAPPRPASG